MSYVKLDDWKAQRAASIAAVEVDPEAELSAIADTVRACYAEHLQIEGATRIKSEAASRESLNKLRMAGEALGKAKAALKGKRGAFGAWCDRGAFGFSSSWRARLIQLAANWTGIEQAVAAQPEGSQNWSLNGAKKTWEQSKPGGKRKGAPRVTINELRTRLAAKDQELAKAKATIETLRKRLKAKSEPGSDLPEPQQFDTPSDLPSHPTLADSNRPANGEVPLH